MTRLTTFLPLVSILVPASVSIVADRVRTVRLTSGSAVLTLRERGFGTSCSIGLSLDLIARVSDLLLAPVIDATAFSWTLAGFAVSLVALVPRFADIVVAVLVFGALLVVARASAAILADAVVIRVVLGLVVESSSVALAALARVCLFGGDSTASSVILRLREDVVVAGILALYNVSSCC